MSSSSEGTHSKVDVAVVGAGPAGLAGAAAVARLGLKCTIVERAQTVGGNIVAIEPDWEEKGPKSESRRAGEILKSLSDLGVDTLMSATAWGIEVPSMALHVAHDGRLSQIRARAVLVASGARERAMPFVGWTLPGVITCGAAQRLVARSRVRPGFRVLVVGRGHLLLRTAAQLVEAGVKVVAMVEATAASQFVVRGIPAVAFDVERMRQAVRYTGMLARAGVPILFGHVIVKAEGDGRVERAVTASLDASFRPISSSERTWVVDAICVSNGLEPETGLLQLAGCEMFYDRGCQAFFPRCDETLRTTVPWIYAAGEAAGIGGSQKAWVEGEVAGLGIALALGAVGEPDVAERLRLLRRARGRHLKGARSVDRVYVEPSLYTAIAGREVVVCRCEEVTLGMLDDALVESDLSGREIKLRTRVGMGLCQGRNCMGTVYQRLIAAAGDPSYLSVPTTCRPPLEPIPLRQLVPDG